MVYGHNAVHLYLSKLSFEKMLEHVAIITTCSTLLLLKNLAGRLLKYNQKAGIHKTAYKVHNIILAKVSKRKSKLNIFACLNSLRHPTA